VILEAALVAMAGLVFALACNALSPRGLRLSRNYFPGDRQSSAPLRPATNAIATSQGAVDNPLAATIQRLEQHGLQAARSNEVTQLFQDPRYEQGLVVFLDARDDQHYKTGHIPGAWQFDRYRPEQFLPTLVPLCLTAEKVVVYCGGGACEDSEFAAIMLRDVGVPREKLFVYAGGFNEWTNNRLPVETGVRLSRQFLKPTP